VRDLFMQGIIPLAGALIMTATFVYGLKNFLEPNWLTDDDGNNVTIFGYGAVGVVGILAMLLGVVLMLAWKVKAPEYFRGETLPMRTSRDLVLAGPYVDSDTYRMPEAGLPEIVISPDLSNLPEGQMAIDPITGDRYIRHPKDDSDKDA
jgi:hypothetical protein